MRKVIEKHKWSVGALKRCVDAYVQHDGRLCYVGKKMGMRKSLRIPFLSTFNN